MTTIRIMKEHERTRVAALVQDTMHNRYGSDAYALPELVFVAEDDCGALTGAMGLSVSDGEPFHLEETYSFDHKIFPAVFDRTTIVELGRWVARVPGIAESLLYASILSAIKRGCAWGIGEVKPQVARRFAGFGITVIPLFGTPNLAKIPAGALPYYCSPPSPMLVAIALHDAAAVLYKKVAPFVREKRILFLGI